jgi:hypothetical protein
MFWLRSVTILSDVVVILLSSIVVLTPNGIFFSCVSIAFSERTDALEQQKLKLNSPDSIHFDHALLKQKFTWKSVQQFQRQVGGQISTASLICARTTNFVCEMHYIIFSP